MIDSVGLGLQNSAEFCCQYHENLNNTAVATPAIILGTVYLAGLLAGTYWMYTFLEKEGAIEKF